MNNVTAGERGWEGGKEGGPQPRALWGSEATPGPAMLATQAASPPTHAVYASPIGLGCSSLREMGMGGSVDLARAGYSH